MRHESVHLPNTTSGSQLAMLCWHLEVSWVGWQFGLIFWRVPDKPPMDQSLDCLYAYFWCSLYALIPTPLFRREVVPCQGSHNRHRNSVQYALHLCQKNVLITQNSMMMVMLIICPKATYIGWWWIDLMPLESSSSQWWKSPTSPTMTKNSTDCNYSSTSSSTTRTTAQADNSSR